MSWNPEAVVSNPHLPKIKEVRVIPMLLQHDKAVVITIFEGDREPTTKIVKRTGFFKRVEAK